MQPFTEDILRQVTQFRDRGISVREIGIRLGYDESTILKWLKTEKGVDSIERFRIVFSEEQEKQTGDHGQALDLRFYGLTLKSERNDITHPFSRHSKLAGRNWTRQFMERSRLSYVLFKK